MAKPWERYQAEGKPWERFQPSQESNRDKAEAALARMHEGLMSPEPILGDRAVGLARRWVAEGATDVIAPYANAANAAVNLAANVPNMVSGQPYQQVLSENVTDEVVRPALTQAGVPLPESAAEKWANTIGRFGTSVFGGAPIFNRAASAFGYKPPTPGPRPMQRGETAAARTLQDQGVQLDRAQRTGGAVANRVRDVMTDHPVTISRAEKFTKDQLAQYTRAVLRTIGVESDDASQTVMEVAKSRISRVFQDVANKSPAVFDDTLQADLSRIVQTAADEVTEAELKILQNNVDRILNAAIKGNGQIHGPAFNNIRESLGRVSRRPDVGHFAKEMQEALLASLQRSAPDESTKLTQAINQWRNMRIIEQAIDKGTEKFISPLRLSNVVAQARNRAMSVYGQGGDQTLVRLAEAGRDVLPRSIPNSGTIPRGIMAAPLRTLITAPIYKGEQMWLMHQPPPMVTPSRINPLFVPNATGQAANALLQTSK